MKTETVIYLVIFAAFMYGLATAVSYFFEHLTAVVHFMGGIIFAAVGYASATALEGKNYE